MRYQDAILKNAEMERKTYLSYMDKIGLLSAKNVLLYDFCSKGTVQHSLSKLLMPGTHLLGIYFATLDLKRTSYYQSCPIISLFGDCTRYQPQYETVREFMFLEAILSDEYETLICCDANNGFCYQDEGSDYRNIQDLQCIQQGILDFDDALSAWSDLISAEIDTEYRDFCDTVFGVLFHRNCIIGERIKKAVVIDGRNDFKPPYQLLT